MQHNMLAILRSLEVRLLTPLCLTIAAVLAVHALLGFRSTKDHFERFVEAEIERSGRMVIGATHDAMLLNRPEEVQATIERLADVPGMAAIRVYDKLGTITRSATSVELGSRLDLNSKVCLSCHPSPSRPTERVLESSTLTWSSNGHDVLRRLTVIKNARSCMEADCHIHPPEQRILGVLDVGISMAPFDAAISAARRDLLWTTLALLAISSVVVAMFVRRVVHRPVAQLHRGTLRIAAGDLDTRIEVCGADELARLGEAFNSMVRDLRQARRDVLEWSQTLEQRVEAKTEELKQAQRQVQHMDTMASLGKLSATVAHELNNPISGILTYARLVKRELAEQSLDDAVHAELERYLTLVDKECTRCGAIVHNLLTFARRRGGAMVAVDLNDILDRCMMLVAHHLQILGVCSETQQIDDNPMIMADAGQIEQALLALLMNAIEAIQAAEGNDPTLSVRLAGTDQSVSIEVSDTGIGITPDALPHIFEPFFSTKGNERGVGLGLAVVYGIVNRHDGAISVDSTPGVGTTFRIELPRQPRHAEDHNEHGDHEVRSNSFKARAREI